MVGSEFYFYFVFLRVIFVFLEKFSELVSKVFFGLS